MAKPPWSETPHQTPDADSLPDDQVFIGEKFDIIVSDWLGFYHCGLRGLQGLAWSDRTRKQEWKKWNEGGRKRERERERKKETL